MISDRPGDEPAPDLLSELASAAIPSVLHGVPPARVREAIAFRRWLDARLAELRSTPLSFTDADVPAGRVHQALGRRIAPPDDSPGR